jgi:Type II secretion system (T2SS), protein E, N-terminal domain
MSTPLRERPDAPLGTLIFRAGLLPAETIENALEEGVKTGRRLGEILIERGLIKEEDLTRLLAGQKGLPFVNLRERSVDPQAARLLAEDQARLFTALPVGFEDGVPVVALADPTNEVLNRNIREAIGQEARFVVAARSELNEVIGEVFSATIPEAPEPVAVEPAPEPEPEVAPEPLRIDTRVQPEPTPELLPEPEPEPAPEPTFDPSEYDLTPAAEATPETEVEAVLPAVEAEAVLPAVEAEAAEAVLEPAMESEPALEPEPQVALEPAPEPEPEPEPAPEPVFEAPAEPEPLVAPLATEPAAPQTVQQSNGQVPEHFEDDPPPPSAAPPAGGAGFRVSIRLTSGERMTVAECEDVGEAKGYAKALTKQLGATDSEDWPFVNGRFLKPDTIVSVDVETL